MSIRAARFEVTTGGEFSAVTGAAGLTGGGATGLKKFTQPDFRDDDDIDNQVTLVGGPTADCTGTLAAGATTTIDLTALVGPDGSAVTLATLVGVYIQVTSATGLLRVGNAAADAHALTFGAATHTITLHPGPDASSRGPGLAIADPSGTGWVVDGTHKNVKLENTHGSESVTYVAYFGGR